MTPFWWIALAALLLAACGTIENCDQTEKVLADIGLAKCKDPPPLVSLEVTATSEVVEVNSTQQIVATGTFEDNSTDDLSDSVAWTSSDEDIATVDAAGLATAAGAGTTTITASAGDISATMPLSVHAKAAAPKSTSNVFVIKPTPVTTSGDLLEVDIPDAAQAIGIILRGTNSNYKIVDHGIFLSSGGNPVYITDPNGDPVPLSFNMIENAQGVEEPYGDNLANREAEALFFPNDGTTATLPAGTYTFPIGSFNAEGSTLEDDTLTPYVLYKTSAPAGQTMRLNLFVVEGVASGITTAEQAETDPEIVGAIAVLRNVYETRVGLTLDIRVKMVPHSSFITLDSQEEQDALLKSFPLTAPSNALNLFIVGELAFVESGVIGLSAGIPGPFNLDGTVVSGTLAEYQGDGTGTILGFTLAHEFGHFLGLWHPSQVDGSQANIIGHDPIADTPECTDGDLGGTGNIDNCPDRSNLMFPVVDEEPDPPVTAGQIQVIELNLAVSVP